MVENIFISFSQHGPVSSHAHKNGTVTWKLPVIVFLFRSQHQPVLTKSVSSLANPMTYLHDHPYSDLQQYGENIKITVTTLECLQN
jgi:hypothetical protein